ncbi:MAG: hypothetical protein JO069_18895 [Verrucomicrobia bacterium]|nr:hypothetical protein [Verrucomicrobiota bacterium]
MGLNTIKDIEGAIDALTPEQLEELHQWLARHHPPPVNRTIDNPELSELRQKNFVELCAPVRGLMEDIDFSRNPSTARPLNL